MTPTPPPPLDPPFTPSPDFDPGENKSTNPSDYNKGWFEAGLERGKRYVYIAMTGSLFIGGILGYMGKGFVDSSRDDKRPMRKEQVVDEALNLANRIEENDMAREMSRNPALNKAVELLGEVQEARQEKQHGQDVRKITGLKHDGPEYTNAVSPLVESQNPPK